MSEVKVNVDKVDWKLLQEQKRALLKAITAEEVKLSSGAPTAKDDKVQKTIDGLSGILNLLDDVQDQVADQLGEEVVFGESGEYEISLPDMIKNDGSFMSLDQGVDRAEAIRIAQDRYGADERGMICVINKL